MIVVNDNYQRVPNADVLFGHDGPWWRYHHARIQQTCPAIARYSTDPRARELGVEFIRGKPLGRDGQKMVPAGEDWIYRGAASGYAAIHLAIRFRACHICLVGMDCQRGKDGKAHWFGDHPARFIAPQPFEMWRQELDDLAAPCAEHYIRLIQCSLEAATTKVTRGSIFEELRAPEERSDG